jgi:hypothetical protein
MEGCGWRRGERDARGHMIGGYIALGEDRWRALRKGVAPVGPTKQADT